MTQLGDLNLPSAVVLAQGNNGLPVLKINSKMGTGCLYLHGAHITDWTPVGTEPVLWLSEQARFESGQAIRGGVPLVGPWFGRGPHQDQTPAHGWLRIREWTPVAVSQSDDGAVTFQLQLASEQESEVDLVADFAVTFGRTLNLALRMVTGRKSFLVSDAFHPYFLVGDVRNISIDGLAETDYFDQLTHTHHTQQGSVRFESETDRIYRSSSTITINDPDLNRKIRIEKQSSASTVVWNPWQEKAAVLPDFSDHDWTRMVCVEPANVGEDAIRLEPYQEHTLMSRFTVLAGD